MEVTLRRDTYAEFYTSRMSASVDVSLDEHFRELTLESLRIYLAVAQSGSFRSAAARLDIAQPTVGRAVSALERQFGVPLLERGPRGVRITEEGEALADGARRLLRAARALRQDVRGGRGTELRLGATATHANVLLSPCLGQWLPSHPKVRVTAVEDGELILTRKLQRGDCDVAIVTSPIPDDLDSLHLSTVGVVAVFPASHPGARSSEPVTIADLGNEPLLVNGMKYPSTRLLIRSMEVAGIVPRIVYESGVGRTLASMAEAGLGVAVFGSTASWLGVQVATRPVVTATGEPMAFDLHVAWSRERHTPLCKEFAISLATFHRSQP